MIELLGKNIFIDNDFEIKEYLTTYGNMRVLYNKGAVFSATFTNKDIRNYLCDYYMSFYDIPIFLKPTGKEFLVLGGGAFSYPKHYISKYPDKNMTVVEIDDRCIKIAKDYFYLNDLIEKYDPNGNRLEIVIDDAIKYISNCIKKYDYILIDLFNGNRPLKEMFCLKNLNNVKKILKEDGIVIINYVVSEKNFLEYKLEIKNLINITKYYKIISNEKYFAFDKKHGNLLIVLSNKFITIPYHYNYVDVNDIL